MNLNLNLAQLTNQVSEMSVMMSSSNYNDAPNQGSGNRIQLNKSIHNQASQSDPKDGPSEPIIHKQEEEKKVSSGLSQAAKKFDFASFSKVGAPPATIPVPRKSQEEKKVPT